MKQSKCLIPVLVGLLLTVSSTGVKAVSVTEIFQELPNEGGLDVKLIDSRISPPNPGCCPDNPLIFHHMNEETDALDLAFEQSFGFKAQPMGTALLTEGTGSKDISDKITILITDIAGDPAKGQSVNIRFSSADDLGTVPPPNLTAAIPEDGEPQDISPSFVDTNGRTINIPSGFRIYVQSDREPGQSIPEPSSWLLFGTGLLCLLGYSRKRKLQIE